MLFENVHAILWIYFLVYKWGHLNITLVTW